MYLTNPLVASSSVALVAGAANVVAVAAPGATMLHRIVGCTLHINRLATGVVDLTISGTGGTGTIIAARGLQLTGTSGYPIPIPEPGLVLLPNEGIQLNTVSTAAAGSGFVILYYFTDTI